MNATQLFHQISLHDSLITGFTRDPEAGVLRLKIELGNYNQRTYDAAKDPETIPGELLFVGVSDYTHEPKNGLAITDDQDGQIINLEATPAGDGLSDIKIVVVVSDYRADVEETQVFKFRAKDVAWHPDSGS